MGRLKGLMFILLYTVKIEELKMYPTTTYIDGEEAAEVVRPVSCRVYHKALHLVAMTTGRHIRWTDAITICNKPRHWSLCYMPVRHRLPLITKPQVDTNTRR